MRELARRCVTALADAGEPDRGRVFLEGWPAAMRDARYWRLRGRWDLEYDHRPDQAIPAFRAALEVLPHDWRTHYRLARALRDPEPSRRGSKGGSDCQPHPRASRPAHSEPEARRRVRTSR